MQSSQKLKTSRIWIAFILAGLLGLYAFLRRAEFFIGATADLNKERALRQYELHRAQEKSRLLSQNKILQEKFVELQQGCSRFSQIIEKTWNQHQIALSTIKREWIGATPQHLDIISSDLGVLLEILGSSKLDQLSRVNREDLLYLKTQVLFWQAMQTSDLLKKSQLIKSIQQNYEALLNLEPGLDIAIQAYNHLQRIKFEFSPYSYALAELNALIQRVVDYLEQKDLQNKTAYIVHRKAIIEYTMAQEQANPQTKRQHFLNSLEHCRSLPERQQTIAIAILIAYIQHYHLPEYQEACKVYQRIYQQEKSCAVALYALGELARIKEKNQEALKYYNKALEINVGSPRYLVATALTKYTLGKSKEAFKDLQDVVKKLKDLNPYKKVIIYASKGDRKMVRKILSGKGKS